MPGRRSRDDDGDPDDEEEERPVRRRPGPRRSPRKPLRRWESEESDEESGGPEEEGEEHHGLFHRPKDRVYFRARDSIYFEPLVALAIIVLLLVSLYAYTSNWPPVYVIESESMQHGSTDTLGLINTGDLVLAQRLPSDQVQTYIDGDRSGYTTYGEFGDVLLYHPDGAGGTPVIHRAILFLEANPNGSWNAPSLVGLSCGPNGTADYTLSPSATGCGTIGMRGVLTLHHVGWMSVDVVVPLDSLGSSTGFLTMGDNNYQPGTPGTGITDQSAGISPLVQPGWMVGVARGSIPWIGSVKLLLQGNAQEVPDQSWEYLGLTIVGLVLAAMGLHYLLRAEGVEDPRRKAQEEEEEDEEEDDDDGSDEDEGASATGRRAWLHPIRSWRAEHEEPVVDVEPHRGRRAGARSVEHGGRPEPRVGRRTSGARRRRHRDDEDDDSDL